MVVSKLMDYLRYGELADLAISDIEEQINLDKMFTYLNRGLKKMNSELALLESSEVITLVSNVVSYQLTDPLVLRIRSAYDQEGAELNLNIESDYRSVIVTGHDTVSFTGHRDNTDNLVTSISIAYLKDFPEITDSDDVVPISEGLLEVLVNYVAYLAHGSTSMAEGSSAHKYQAQYEIELGKARKFGYKTGLSNNIDKLRLRGFA
tara:strand:- start:145 stop:762 length:618 start_codon:yes stop_codon:yes gene_type:complete